MARRVYRSSILVKILVVACGVAGWVCVQAPVALAQHGGHAGGVPHVSMPHPVAPPISHAPPVSHAPIGRPYMPIAPPVGGFGPAFHYPVRPIRPRPVPPPVFIYPYPAFWGWPGYGFAWGWKWGWGWNGCWSWANCDLLWNWGLCYNPPFYSYGSYVTPSYVAPPSYAYPTYAYGVERNDLPQLYLNDGTVLNVTDYWVVDGQLHYRVIDNRKSVEQVVPFEELDLQRTIDVASRRGFRFVLRNQPLEEYLKNDREAPPPERK